MKNRIEIAALATFVFLATGSIIGQRAASPADLKPCDVPTAERGKTEKGTCGKLEVFENRDTRRGRKIPINIVVLPATGKEKATDPVFYIAGGPGSSATEDAPYVAADLAKIRERRDLVFVDQRGTGGSNPLNCELFDPKNLNSYLGHWNPPDAVRECRKKLEKTADLKLYVTSIAMDDLDDVRKALGYEKINLAGSSYGTRAVMEYVRRYGANVRTIHLHGISPSYQFMPRDFPQHTQLALDGVLDECLADANCANAFPNIKADTNKVLAALKKGPVEVEIVAESKPAKVKLSRDLAGEAIRYMLYQSGAAARIPLVISEAANGNFKPLAEAALFYRRVIVATGATGLYLSITCAEDLPFVKGDEGLDQEDTFLGTYRLRQQREACTLWPRGEIPAGYSNLVRSNVPALIYSGQWDPVTPPEYGERLAKSLPNSLHIVVPSGGHGISGLEGLDCIKNISARFVETGTVAGIDTACIGKISRRGFQLQPQP